MMAQVIKQIKNSENDYALNELIALVKIPGALKVITGIPSENATFLGPWHPYGYILNDVIKIKGPDQKGRYRAITAEKDFCIGKPIDLLQRLTEYQRWVMAGKRIQHDGEFFVPDMCASSKINL